MASLRIRFLLVLAASFLSCAPLVQASDDGSGAGGDAAAASTSSSTSGTGGASLGKDAPSPHLTKVKDLLKAFFSKQNAPRSLGQTVAAWTALAFIILLVHEQKVKAAALQVEQVKTWVQLFLANEMTTDGLAITQKGVVRRINDALAAVEQVKSSGLGTGISIPLIFGLFSAAAGVFAWKFGSPDQGYTKYAGTVVGAFTTLILSIIAGVRGANISAAHKALRTLRDAVNAHDSFMSYGGPSPSQARINDSLNKVGDIGNTGSTVAMNIVTVLGGSAMAATQIGFAGKAA